MAIRINKPFDQYFEVDGTPLDNGYLYIGTANLNPVISPIATYWDEALTQPAAQPLRTMNGYLMRGNSPGRVYIANNDYSIMLKSCNGTVIWSASSAAGDAIIDVLNLFAAPDGSDLIGYTAPDTLDVMTVQDRLEWLDGVSPPTANNSSYAGANINILRDASSVSGGTPGFVNVGFIAKTITGATETAFEWNVLGILDNHSASGENVAGYFQGNKKSTGATWGLVAQVEDQTGTANGGLTAFEIDIGATGADTFGARFGIQMVGYRYNKTGAVAEIGTGIYVGSALDDLAGSYFGTGMLLRDDMITGIHIATTGANSIYGLRDTGTRAIGAEFVGSYSVAAIRIDAGQKLGFDLTGTVYMQMDTGVLGLNGTWMNFQQSIGITGSGNTYSSASAGAASALPAKPFAYFKVRIDGVAYKVPCYI